MVMTACLRLHCKDVLLRSLYGGEQKGYRIRQTDPRPITFSPSYNEIVRLGSNELCCRQ